MSDIEYNLAIEGVRKKRKIDILCKIDAMRKFPYARQAIYGLNRYWPGRDSDMLAISCMFTDARLALHISAESGESIIYYVNGRKQACHGRTEFPRFDPKKLL